MKCDKILVIILIITFVYFMYNIGNDDSFNEYYDNNINNNMTDINDKILNNNNGDVNSKQNKNKNLILDSNKTGDDTRLENELDKHNYNNDVKSNDLDDNYASYGSNYSLDVKIGDPKKNPYINPTLNNNKNKLDKDKLLPKEIEDWWPNPTSGTTLENANLLSNAVKKIGIDTQNSSLKNPSYDIRGGISIPKANVSIWNQSSIEPDYNMKKLC